MWIFCSHLQKLPNAQQLIVFFVPLLQKDIDQHESRTTACFVPQPLSCRDSSLQRLGRPERAPSFRSCSSCSPNASSTAAAVDAGTRTAGRHSRSDGQRRQGILERYCTPLGAGDPQRRRKPTIGGLEQRSRREDRRGRQLLLPGSPHGPATLPASGLATGRAHGPWHDRRGLHRRRNPSHAASLRSSDGPLQRDFVRRGLLPRPPRPDHRPLAGVQDRSKEARRRHLLLRPGSALQPRGEYDDAEPDGRRDPGAPSQSRAGAVQRHARTAADLGPTGLRAMAGDDAHRRWLQSAAAIQRQRRYVGIRQQSRRDLRRRGLPRAPTGAHGRRAHPEPALARHRAGARRHVR